MDMYTIQLCRLSGRLREQARSHIWIVGCQVDRRRLGGRHRRQARSHIWIVGARWIGVGWEAAIAGKPAPTFGLWGARWIGVGWKAGIAGKPAPTFGLWGARWIGVGWEAAIAGKPAPTGSIFMPTDSALCCMNSEDAHPAQQRNPCAATSPRAEWTGRIIRSETAFVLQTILNKCAHSKCVTRDCSTQPPHNFVFDQ